MAAVSPGVREALSEAVARAARERSEHEREIQRFVARDCYRVAISHRVTVLVRCA